MKCLLAILIIFTIAGSLFPQESSSESAKKPGQPESLLDSNVSFSIVPLTYWNIISYMADTLDYDYDRSQSTSYETNFKLGYFSFGGLASVNNNVIGKIDTLLGYVGFSSVSLKISEGHLRGTGHWSGDMALDMQREFKFDDKVRSIDLIYNGKDDVLEGLKAWYVGITYTELTTPMEVSVDLNPVNSAYNTDGKPVYDEKFSLKSYGIVFGVDSLKYKTRKPGLDMLAITQDRFCIYNNYKFSNAAIERVKALNPGYQLGSTSGKDWYPLGAGYLDNESALGVCWNYKFSDGWIIFAVGYDLIWGLIAGPAYKSGGEGEMTLSGDLIMFFRHGIILRVYGTW